jgi:CheY-like chemotaxis protein
MFSAQPCIQRHFCVKDYAFMRLRIFLRQKRKARYFNDPYHLRFMDRHLLSIPHGFAMTKCQSVLIVDDDARLADTFAIALRRVGFAARTAHNGVHGYASYFRNPTAWVVTDIEMVELDGIEMMRCIRAIHPTVKTIYMTAAAQKYAPALSTEAREFCAKVLRKPFASKHLTEQVTGQPESVSLLIRKSPPQLYGNAFARPRQLGVEIARIMQDYHKRLGRGCGMKLGIGRNHDSARIGGEG